MNWNGQVVDNLMWWTTIPWQYTRDSYIHSDSNTHLKIIEFLIDNLHNFVYHSIKICDILLDFIQLSPEKRIWNSSVSRKNDLCARNIELGKVKLLHLCLKTFAKVLKYFDFNFYHHTESTLKLSSVFLHPANDNSFVASYKIHGD